MIEVKIVLMEKAITYLQYRKYLKNHKYPKHVVITNGREIIKKYQHKNYKEIVNKVNIQISELLVTKSNSFFVNFGSLNLDENTELNKNTINFFIPGLEVMKVPFKEYKNFFKNNKFNPNVIYSIELNEKHKKNNCLNYFRISSQEEETFEILKINKQKFTTFNRKMDYQIGYQKDFMTYISKIECINICKPTTSEKYLNTFVLKMNNGNLVTNLRILLNNDSNNNKIDYFLSHQSRDKEYPVRNIYQSLLENEKSIWYDEVSLNIQDQILKPKKNTLSKIEEDIANGMNLANDIIILLTENFIRKILQNIYRGEDYFGVNYESALLLGNFCLKAIPIIEESTQKFFTNKLAVIDYLGDEKVIEKKLISKKSHYNYLNVELKFTDLIQLIATNDRKILYKNIEKNENFKKVVERIVR